MENKIVKTMIGAVALSSTAIAGDIAETIVAPTVTNSGDFCNTLKNIGKLYKNKNNPIIQEVKIFGRAHFSYAYVNGENGNGDKFNGGYEEVRRARFGTSIKALNGLELLLRANMVTDNKPRGGDRDWGYNDFDEAILSYNFGTVAGIDDFKVGYGRYKIAVSAEGKESSKKIKTVERSAISNKVFNNRYTGLILSGSRGNVKEARVGLLSLDDSDFVGNWDAGNAIFVDTTFEVAGHDYLFNALYNLDEGSAEDDQVGMDFSFATSLSTNREIAGWNVLFDVILGDNGEDGGAETGGAFWGLVVEPSKYIVEDKVEAVFRYAYQGSSGEEGVSAIRRYFGQGLRDSGGGTAGDQHHSVYAGLNYFFCGHNSKIMIGAEYENLSTPSGTASDAIVWAAYRVYF